MVTGLSGGASGLGGAITLTGELTLFSRFSILSLLSNAADAVFELRIILPGSNPASAHRLLSHPVTRAAARRNAAEPGLVPACGAFAKPPVLIIAQAAVFPSRGLRR